MVITAAPRGVILHLDTTHAPAMADKQGVRSADLLANGIIDLVIPEYPHAGAKWNSSALASAPFSTANSHCSMASIPPRD